MATMTTKHAIEAGEAWAQREADAVIDWARVDPEWTATWIDALPLVAEDRDEVARDEVAREIHQAASKEWDRLVAAAAAEMDAPSAAAAADAHLAAGIAYLRAQPHGDGLAYYEAGTRAWYGVSESDVAELGARLATDPGDYSEWCADTQARDLTADLCHAYEAAHPGRVPGRDLRAIVETAQRDDGPGVSVGDVHAIVVAAEDQS